MQTSLKIISAALFGFIIFSITACAPEVGSEQWCNDMKKMPKADWSTNQLTDYGKHCIFK